jgi:hypothetical protein
VIESVHRPRLRGLAAAIQVGGLLALTAVAVAQTAPETAPPTGDNIAEAPAEAVSPAPIVDAEAVIRIEGVAENRFNPTHGTVFFVLNGADFPTQAGDVAVLLNDAQLPSPDVSLSRRIVAASYVMSPGLNELILRSWDAEGRLMSADALVWAGDRLLVIDVVDLAGQPVEGATVTAHLANQRAVQATVDAPGGVAQFLNLPDESIAVEARHPDGRSGSIAVPPEVQRAILTLR